MRNIIIDLNNINPYLYYSEKIVQGENKASQLKLILSPEFVGYKYILNFKLNDLVPYNTLELLSVDGVINYVLTNVCTFEAGELKCELQAFDLVTDVVVKTFIFLFKITPAIDGTPVLIPEEYSSYIQIKEVMVQSVNNVAPIETNVSLTTDNIPETVSNRYVPVTPIDPTFKQLDGNGQFNIPIMAYLSYYLQDNNTPQDIADSGIWRKLILPSINEAVRYNINTDVVNSYFVVAQAGIYFMVVNFSSKVNATNVTLDTAMFNNDLIVPSMRTSRYIQTANNLSSTAFGGIIQLNAGDKLDLRVKHTTGGNIGLTVVHTNFNMMLIRPL